mmetsp:Transcript_16215/g.48184  ORF Transcript_16215/g.48184 Transcript_16215/m.48184 type:complete len:260 (-) Transcript_16215:418-1197(-)
MLVPQQVHVVHIVIVHVLAYHRRDEVGADVAAFREDAPGDACVEGDDRCAGAEADDRVRLPDPHPHDDGAQLRERVRGQPADRPGPDGEVDAAWQVVVHCVRHTRAALEIHVNAHVRADDASASTEAHRDHEIDVGDEIHNDRNDHHEEGDDGRRPEEVRVHASVDHHAHVFHAVDPHVLHQQLAAEVRHREEPERRRKTSIEERESRHREPEFLADLPARSVVGLLDVAPRRDVPRRVRGVDVRRLLGNQAYGSVPQR